MSLQERVEIENQILFFALILLKMLRKKLVLPQNAVQFGAAAAGHMATAAAAAAAGTRKAKKAMMRIVARLLATLKIEAFAMHNWPFSKDNRAYCVVIRTQAMLQR